MSVILAVVVLLMQPAAVGALLAPPVVIAVRRRRVVPGMLLYLGAVGSLFGWLAAWNADFDHADATGAGGNAFAVIGWFLAAMLLAGAAIAVTRTPPRAALPGWSGDA